MPTKHSVYDSDTHFSINPVTRALKNESLAKTGVIQYDHNSERFTFEIPKVIEGHDMSQCDIIQVHYNNIDSQTKEQNKGVYEVTDMQISPEDEDVVILSWLISGNATKFVGSLNFLIRFACTGDEGHVYYVWNTAIYSGISVSSGINNGEAVVDQYADILNQWKEELEANQIVDLKQTQVGSGDGGVNVWTATFGDGRTSNFEVKNGSMGDKPIRGVDYWTDADQKAIEEDAHTYITNELAKRNQVVPLFANSIAECTDTTKLYVLPDGFYYAYMKKTTISTAENKFNASGSVLNAVMGSSSTSTSNGYVWSNLIPIDLTRASPFVVRVEGTKIATDTSTTQKMWLCDSAGAKLSATLLHHFEDGNPINNYTHVESDGSFWADYKSGAKVSDSIITNTKYIRIGFAMNPGTVLTVNDLADVSITFDVDNVSGTTEDWFSTGYAFNQPADYSAEVAQLTREVNTLNEKIIELENASAVNGASLNKNTCSIFRKVVCCGDSLTAGYINIGAGVFATNEDYAWPHYMALLTGNEYVNCGDSGADVWTWQTRERGLVKARATGLVQAYLVGLGVNDASLVTLGTAADIGTENKTYYGGMSKIIRVLNAISPKAKIFIQTMPSTSESFKPYSQAIRDIVEVYKDTYPVHCLDLAKYLPLYQTDSILGDAIGGHRTAIGYQQFAENLRVIWSEYINTHISDFQDVYSLPYN